MTSTTPLLLLLDSILSQETERIREARTSIRHIVAKACKGNPRLQQATAAAFSLDGSSDNTNNCLLQDVDLILTAFPNLASVSSSHDGSLPLHFAASIGNVPVAARLVRQYPAAASTPNTKGKIPLHYAAREGRTDMVAFFLQATPDTAKITSKKQKLALHFAAGDGHAEVVRQLLQVYPEGASLPSAKGKIPLHFAARWGHLDIAYSLLLVYPQGVRCVDWDGSLPLHDAAREGQIVMSKFLIERYPMGLTIANIRGEIPLFPAVRTGNDDLVILYLQGWAMGGMHILKSVSADDNIQDWDWNIVELCLRGAVENFSGCALLEGKVAPAVCCPVEREDCLQGLDEKQPSSSSSRVMEVCCQWRQQQEAPTCSGRSLVVDPAMMSSSEAVESPQQGTTASSAAQLACQDSAARSCSSATTTPAVEAVPRSKSPILEQGGSRMKKRISIGGGCNDRKRMKGGPWHEGDEALEPNLERPRRFIALHAALACGTSSHVIMRAMNHNPAQLMEADEQGQLPLHLAVRHPACSAINHTSLDGTSRAEEGAGSREVLKIVLQDILKPYPGAAFIADYRGRLALHLAIAARADFSIIHALIKANPSSGVDPIESGDSRFVNKPPLYMATEYNCDLSTTYLLLRGDPSVVSSTGNK